MKRIIHLSDLHFGTQREGLVDLLLIEINQLNPDLVVISGDLTQRAKHSQFIQMRNFLNLLNKDTLCVPGNHDISLYNLIERFFYPLNKYKKWISQNLCASRIIDNVAILGINSVTPYKSMSGFVTETQLKLVINFFNMQPKNRFKIVVMHHNLISSQRHKVINDADKLINIFSSCGVNLVLSGHIHAQHTELLKQNNQSSLYVVTAGTAISYRTIHPNSFNVIDISDGGFQLIVKEYKDNHFVISSNRYFPI